MLPRTLPAGNTLVGRPVVGNPYDIDGVDGPTRYTHTLTGEEYGNPGTFVRLIRPPVRFPSSNGTSHLDYESKATFTGKVDVERARAGGRRRRCSRRRQPDHQHHRRWPRGSRARRMLPASSSDEPIATPALYVTVDRCPMPTGPPSPATTSGTASRTQRGERCGAGLDGLH